MGFDTAHYFSLLFVKFALSLSSLSFLSLSHFSSLLSLLSLSLHLSFSLYSFYRTIRKKSLWHGHCISSYLSLFSLFSLSFCPSLFLSPILSHNVFQRTRRIPTIFQYESWSNQGSDSLWWVPTRGGCKNNFIYEYYFDDYCWCSKYGIYFFLFSIVFFFLFFLLRFYLFCVLLF